MLYKGRYIISFYDKEENLLGVYDNIKELAKANGLEPSSVSKAISNGSKRFELVDVSNVVEDCFKETDESLKKMFEDGELSKPTNIQLAKKMGISVNKLQILKKRAKIRCQNQ